MNDQVEEYYEEDDEEEYEGGSFRRWGLVIGVGVGVVCLGLILVLWFGRDVLLAPLARLNATDTPTVTNTMPATATFTEIPPTETAAVTFTLAPSPTQIKIPALEIMSMISGPPVLQETFDDNSRSWSALGEGSEFTIQEGSMMVRSNQTGIPGVVYCSGQCGPFKDNYYYEADVVDERATEFGHGLVFGINGQKNAYYLFKVRPGLSEYGLFKYQNGTSTPLIDWTSSPAVLPAPQLNTLGVSFIAGTMDLYLNGTRINSYADRNPLTDGLVGFGVDQDGIRLMAQQAVVYELIPRTPQAPQPGQLPAATLQPGVTQPAVIATSTTSRFTATPTRAGACPAYVPEGQWVLVVTIVAQQPRAPKIEINGTVYELKELITPFYLLLNQKYTVKTSGRTYEFFQTECKIEYVRAK